MCIISHDIVLELNFVFLFLLKVTNLHFQHLMPSFFIHTPPPIQKMLKIHFYREDNWSHIQFHLINWVVCVAGMMQAHVFQFGQVLRFCLKLLKIGRSLVFLWVICQILWITVSESLSSSGRKTGHVFLLVHRWIVYLVHGQICESCRLYLWS